MLPNLVQHVTLPIYQYDDKLRWKHTNNGVLSLKDAYLFKTNQPQRLNWIETIWSPDIPPTKSLLTWRLMYNKIPTDDQLILRGFSITSLCSCSKEAQETSLHLFLHCKYASRLWSWPSNVLQMNLQIQSFEDIWHIADRGWSPQCKVVIQASLVNILGVIWFVRNQLRYYDILIP